MVRTQKRKKAAAARVPLAAATRPNQRWSMDFVHDRLVDQRCFRVLTVVDQFTRECILLLADQSLTAAKMTASLDRVIAGRGAPESITVDNELNARAFCGVGHNKPVAAGKCGRIGGSTLRTVSRGLPRTQGTPAEHSKHKIRRARRSLQRLKQHGGPVEGPSIIYEVKGASTASVRGIDPPGTCSS
jgi:transposase InsO family protein